MLRPKHTWPMPGPRWHPFRNVQWGAVWLVIVALVLVVVLAWVLAYVQAPTPVIPGK
jgi:hypothetical protein